MAEETWRILISDAAGDGGGDGGGKATDNSSVPPVQSAFFKDMEQHLKIKKLGHMVI